jgi:hypothetical protein
VGLNFLLISKTQHGEYLIKIRGELTELKFELITFSSDTMLNHHLSHKLKLIEKNKFNYLIITL